MSKPILGRHDHLKTVLIVGLEWEVVCVDRHHALTRWAIWTGECLIHESPDLLGSTIFGSWWLIKAIPIGYMPSMRAVSYRRITLQGISYPVRSHISVNRDKQSFKLQYCQYYTHTNTHTNTHIYKHVFHYVCYVFIIISSRLWSSYFLSSDERLIRGVKQRLTVDKY